MTETLGAEASSQMLSDASDRSNIHNDSPLNLTRMIRMGGNETFIKESRVTDHVQNTPMTLPTQGCQSRTERDEHLLQSTAVTETQSAAGLMQYAELSDLDQTSLTIHQSLLRFEWFRLLIAQILAASGAFAVGIACLFSLMPLELSAIYFISIYLGVFAAPLLWVCTCVISQLKLMAGGGERPLCRRQIQYRAIWYIWFSILIASTTMPIIMIIRLVTF